MNISLQCWPPFGSYFLALEGASSHPVGLWPDLQVRELFEMDESIGEAWGKLNSCLPQHQKAWFSLAF